MSTSLRRYYRGDDLVGMHNGLTGQTSYYHFDHQGTTQCLTDKTGTVTDRFASDAWGVEVKRTGSSINRHWYIGSSGYYKQIDLTATYLRDRYLSLHLGRFVSVDSITPHWYVYAENSPALHIDPTGLISIKPVGKPTKKRLWRPQLRLGFRSIEAGPMRWLFHSENSD